MIVNLIPTGGIKYASSRIRMFWVAEEMENAIVTPPIKISEDTSQCDVVDADVYIWQKYFDLEFIRDRKDAMHIWDICDPIWWFSPEISRSVIGLCDKFVCCTRPLAEDFKKWSGLEAQVVPDRMKLSHFTTQRVHQDTDEIKFIWYGISQNRVSLAGIWANLARLAVNGHKISLTIMDDEPRVPLTYGNEFPIHYVKWGLDWEIDVLAQHDMALLPPYPGPWGDLKSNNKHLTAWGGGLPVVDGLNYDDLLQHIKSFETRQYNADRGFSKLNDLYDVKQSAKQLEGILNE